MRKVVKTNFSSESITSSYTNRDRVVCSKRNCVDQLPHARSDLVVSQLSHELCLQILLHVPMSFTSVVLL